MIVSDVITRVRRTFGDAAAVQVDDADIIRWINDAQIAIITRNDGPLQKTGLIDLVANQSSYSLPTDLLILRALRYKFPDMQSFGNLRYYSIQQFDESIDGWDGTGFSAGHPNFFTVFEDKVTLFPTPDTAVVGGLKVLYNQKPTDVDDAADALSLPLLYHNAVVKYCMWQASLLDEDHDPALMYAADFKEDVDVLKGRETQDSSAVYPTITVLEFDM